MIKHIGKHGDRKVAIIFREIPGEDHMCLVIYPDTMPVAMHDSIMKVIESDVGQTAEHLGDALFRSLFPDGRAMLQTLHEERMMKKVQTKQVVVTPTSNSHVNLEEMNNIIRQMTASQDAARRLADLDANSGMTGRVRPRDDFGREVGAPTAQVRQGSSAIAGSDAAKALDNAALAQDLQTQAQRMASEARALLVESERLQQEANHMLGDNPTTKKPRRTRTKTKVVADATQ